MADHDAPSLSHSPAPSFVGREREQAVLRDALDAALAGRGSLVLIGGEAGIGKTALAETLCREAAERGALVLVGRCYDLSLTPPYGPWREALDRAPAGDGLPALSAAALPPERGGASVSGQEALFRHARDYLVALAARQPRVLLLEDLHWADPASLELLRALARDLAATPLLLLATYRADELTRHHPLYQLLPTLVRESRAARLDLRPVDRRGLVALVRGRYALAPDAEARLVTYLQARAEGNPFFTGELLRTLEEEGLLHAGAAGGWTLGDLAGAGIPALLRQVLEGRVGRLGEAARDLLAIAAVIGQDVSLTLWAAVGAVEEEALLEVVGRAAAAHLLLAAADGTKVRFVHALVRETLYEGLLPPRRRPVHRRAGEALEATASPDPDAVGHHFQRAGDDRAAAWLVRAGERAEAARAWLTAAERYAAALTLLGEDDVTAGARGWLLFRIGRMRRVRDPLGGIAALGEAARLGRVGGDALLPLVAARQRGLLRCLAGDFRRGLAELTAALAALDDRPPAMAAQEARWLGGRGALAHLALFLAYAGRYAESATLVRRIAAQGDASGALLDAAGVPDADAYLANAMVQLNLGRPTEARAAFGRARALSRDEGNHLAQAFAATEELAWVVLPYQAERLDERQALATEAAAAWSRGSAVHGDPDPDLFPLPLLLVEGRWGEARQRAAPVYARRHTAHMQRFLLGEVAVLAHGQGDLAIVATLVREWLPDGPATEPGDTWFLGALALQRLAAVLALDSGDLTAARAWLDAHDRWLAWSGATVGRAEGALGWAAYHRAAGDLDQARVHAASALAYSSDPRQPLALLAARRTLGELDTVAARYGSAAAHLASALSLAEACAAPYERALTHLARAELAAAEGRRVEATTMLDDARAVFAELGAVPALARAADLATRLAPTPAGAAPALPFGLTAREVEVLGLVAEGLSDATIAARLFLSRHTVKAHLRAIYGKLAVPSRTAAVRRAREHGLA